MNKNFKFSKTKSGKSLFDFYLIIQSSKLSDLPLEYVSKKENFDEIVKLINFHSDIKISLKFNYFRLGLRRQLRVLGPDEFYDKDETICRAILYKFGFLN